MPEKSKLPAHSKLADVERLRLQRYMTKGAGAIAQARRDGRASSKTAIKKLPSVDQLRAQVAKVGKTKISKHKTKRTRR